jgi:hypothetical protein
MIGAFAAFDVPAGRAVVGVLAYRAISFWLPTIPGIAGYVKLRSTVRFWRIEDGENEHGESEDGADAHGENEHGQSEHGESERSESERSDG